jgi:hypothetical protein
MACTSSASASLRCAQPVCSIGAWTMPVGRLPRVVRLGLESAVVHRLRDEAAHVRVHAPRGAEEDAALGRDGRRAVEQVVERRVARAAGMHALDRLRELHLVAEQH